MPLLYFAAAGLGVVVVTVITGVIRTEGTRREMSQQLPLAASNPDDRGDAHAQQPAAMVSARS